jgi:catechol 2,3-dioxygenase-like lactoylglutathione lyase family enzyme
VIEQIGIVTVCVRDQDRALDFYVGKLGFVKGADAGAEGYRWVTVVPPGSQTQLYLAKAGPGELHSAEEIGGQTGIMLQARDVETTYHELAARGVHFLQPPARLSYGVQAQFEDADGNVFFLQELPA